MENKTNKREKNIAFIDGQNLHLGILENDWKDVKRKIEYTELDKKKRVPKAPTLFGPLFVLIHAYYNK